MPEEGSSTCCKLVGGIALSSGVTKGALKDTKKEDVGFELVISFMTCLGLSNTFWELCGSFESVVIQKH